MMTLVTRIGPENQKGAITGIFRSLGSLARACGPIIASISKKFFYLIFNLNMSCKKHNFLFSILDFWQFGLLLNWCHVIICASSNYKKYLIKVFMIFFFFFEKYFIIPKQLFEYFV